MAAIWNSPWDKDNEFYNKVLASGQYWNDFDLAHASQDQNFANTIFNAKTDYDNATTDEGRALANANAEAARRGYNYTSGSFGAEYNPFDQNNSSFWGDEMMGAYNNAKNAPGFTYEKFQAPEKFTYEDFQAPAPFQYEAYQNNTPDWQHSDPYNNAYNNVLNYGDFSYDYTTDPLYDVYAKEYTREGRRASEDALAQAAAMTGGVPSSYANMVGQQAGNYYASQLADKIPELRAQAYNEWQNNYNNLLSKYNVANGHDTFDYGVYSDKLNRDYQQYKDDLNMRYGIYSDDYNRAYNQWADKLNFDYGLYSDDYNRAYNQWQDQVNLDHAINNENYQRLLDTYGMANDNFNLFHGEDREDAAAADAKRLDYAKLLAQYGDMSGLDEYYGGNGRLTNLYAQYLAEQAAKGRGGSLKPTPEQIDYDTERGRLLVNASAGNPELAQQYLTDNWDNMGYTERFSLLQNMGYDNQTAINLAREGGLTGSDFAAYLGAQPTTLKKDDWASDPNLVLTYGTYDNYKNGTPATSTNGGYGNDYSNLYGRARSIMSNAGNSITDQDKAKDQVKSILNGASEAELTDAGMAYILQALGINS